MAQAVPPVKPEPCPICNVSVKPENLVRHIDTNHPRHPDAAQLKESLRQATRYARRKAPRAGLRISRLHVAIVVVVALLVAGAYAAAPYFDPTRNFNRDTCITSEVYHIHPYLRITILGGWHTVPADIGVSPGCTKPLHTHTPSDSTTGFVQLHVEGPVAKDFTLGDFFYIWGQQFTSTRILSYVADGTNRVTMFVDNVENAEYGALVLSDQQRIEIVYGPAS